MYLMSTHPLGTKGWDGHLLTRSGIIIGVQGMSLMSTHPLETKGWDGHLLTRRCVIIRVRGTF